MAVDLKNLEIFVTRSGPVDVVDQEGRLIAYGTSARLDMAHRDQKEAWALSDVQLTLLDELSAPQRAIAGEHITAVEAVNPGYRVVVEDETPDPGPSVKTRGAASRQAS